MIVSAINGRTLAFLSPDEGWLLYSRLNLNRRFFGAGLQSGEVNAIISGCVSCGFISDSSEEI